MNRQNIKLQDMVVKSKNLFFVERKTLCDSAATE